MVRTLADEKFRNARSAGHSGRDEAKRVCEDACCREVADVSNRKMKEWQEWKSP